MDSRTRKMMLVCVAAAAMAAAPLAAAAQAAQSKPVASVDGKWNMSVTPPGSDAMQIAVTFKQDGKKLTGTLVGPQGEVPLEGEYAEGKIMFAISVPGDNGPMNIGFAGNVKEDGSLAGMASGPFGEIPWSATRSK